MCHWWRDDYLVACRRICYGSSLPCCMKWDWKKVAKKWWLQEIFRSEGDVMVGEERKRMKKIAKEKEEQNENE